MSYSLLDYNNFLRLQHISHSPHNFPRSLRKLAVYLSVGGATYANFRRI